MTMRYFLIRPLLCLLTLLAFSDAWAEGVLTHMSGAVSVRHLDGTAIAAQAGLKVQVGETVVTGNDGYVRVEMTDGGEMVLRPNSQMHIEVYSFEHDKPEKDNFVFSLLKGGMRAISGLISKRGDADAYKLKTPTATIGIRGTQFDLRYCLQDCGALDDGTYLSVRYGAVLASNPAGNLIVAAGQVARVPLQQPPVLLLRDPGIGFSPPPAIPKLDEKKKLQALQSTQAGPDQNRGGGSGDAIAGKAAPSAAAQAPMSAATGTEEPSKPDDQTDAATAQAAGTAISPSDSGTVAPPSGSVTPASGGPECSVQ